MLNPNIDGVALGQMFQQDQRVRVEGLLESSFAEDVLDSLQREVKYDYIFFSQGQNQVLSEDQMNAKDQVGRQNLQQDLLQLATQGIGFFYTAYRMDGENEQRAPAILKSLFSLMNNNQMLNLIREITGVKNLASASGQFTRYRPGNYLTRHSDDITQESRQIAYVLNFTKHWHPDWGGLLQFYQKDGTPRDAWEPRFNSLYLFDVQHVHSVTYVTPYAAAPRYALTGWFRRGEDK